MNLNRILDRTSYTGDFKILLANICAHADLGTMSTIKIIEQGFEDVNFVVETDKQKYVFKLYSEEKDLAECQRNVDLITPLITNDIPVPKLYPLNGTAFLFNKIIQDVPIRIIAMDFIEGKDLYKAKIIPEGNDLIELAKVVARINSAHIKADYVFDEWALIHLESEFNTKKKFLNNTDLKLCSFGVNQFQSVNIEKLPRCFTHADLIRSNIIQDKKGKFWIIDFSVAQEYPRILELAVLFCEALYDPNDFKASLKRNLLFLKEYEKRIQLTSYEKESLYAFTCAMHAQHVLQSNYQKVIFEDDSKETDFYYKLGRKGLVDLMGVEDIVAR